MLKRYSQFQCANPQGYCDIMSADAMNGSLNSNASCPFIFSGKGRGRDCPHCLLPMIKFDLPQFITSSKPVWSDATSRILNGCC